MSVNITFGQVRDFMRDRVGLPGMPSEASLGNVISAFNEFTRERGISDCEVVGPILRHGYIASRNAHLDQLRAEGRPKRYMSNRCRNLNCFKELILAVDHESALLEGRTTDLQQALRDLFIGGRKLKPTAAKAGIPQATLMAWCNGATPQRKAERGLRRLEAVCEKEEGALANLLPYKSAKNIVESPTSR